MPVISQPANVATPPVVVTAVCVQPSVPPAFSAIANVTLVVFVATVFPPESSTVTTGWLVQVEVLPPPPGWVVKASWVAAPTVMVKATLVPLVRPGEPRSACRSYQPCPRFRIRRSSPLRRSPRRGSSCSRGWLQFRAGTRWSGTRGWSRRRPRCHRRPPRSRSVGASRPPRWPHRSVGR